jgi:hypothetical protein
MIHDNLPGLADFLCAHAPHFAKWPKERVERWMAWYYVDARLGVIHDGPQVLGLALVRSFHRPDQAKDEYFHDESGQVIWVDALICQHPAALPALIAQARLRFGRRKFFAGNLFKRESRLALIPWGKIEKLTSHDYQYS